MLSCIVLHRIALLCCSDNAGHAEMSMYKSNGKCFAHMEMDVDPQKPEMVMCYREEVARHLVQEAQRLHPEAISFTFDCGISSIELDQQTVTVQRDGANVEVPSLHSFVRVGASMC